VPAVTEDLDRLLRQGWDELRAGAVVVAEWLDNGAKRAADAAGRAWWQARVAAGGITQEVAHRTGEGAAVLAGRIEARPLTSVAVAFFLGLAVGALLRHRRSSASTRRRV
jgi:ElaB/YqjD/DUF883 family membrane-anchored ribosome-binding protein